MKPEWFLDENKHSLYQFINHLLAIQKVDNAIHRINHYPLAWFVLLTVTHWIAIYPVDNIIQPLNNQDLVRVV